MTSTHPTPTSGTPTPPAPGRHVAAPGAVPTAPAPEAVPETAREVAPAPSAPPAPPAPSAGAIETRPAAWHYDDRARLASYRRTAPPPPAAPAAAWIVLLVALSVLIAEWALFPPTAQGQSDANWALLFLMLSSAGALRILFGNPGRHLPSVALILISGAGFLLRSWAYGGEPAAVHVFEAVCGALLVLAGLMALASPTLSTDPPPADPWG